MLRNTARLTCCITIPFVQAPVMVSSLVPPCGFSTDTWLTSARVPPLTRMLVKANLFPADSPQDLPRHPPPCCCFPAAAPVAPKEIPRQDVQVLPGNMLDDTLATNAAFHINGVRLWRGQFAMFDSLHCECRRTFHCQDGPVHPIGRCR